MERAQFSKIGNRGVGTCEDGGFELVNFRLSPGNVQ